jgi:hypothetical protein
LEDRLSELADFRKIHGHCNVPLNCSGEITKLANWVKTQRRNYRLQQEGKTSSMTVSRLQKLESVGFEWQPCISRRQGTPKKANPEDSGDNDNVVINEEDIDITTANTILGHESLIGIDDSDDSSVEALPYRAGDWVHSFKELRGYCRRNGQCTFRCQDPEYPELSKWVFSQRREYRRMVGGKDSVLTPDRVQAMESIGFVWISSTPFLRGSFERNCRLFRNPRALQCSSELQRKDHAG